MKPIEFYSNRYSQNRQKQLVFVNKIDADMSDISNMEDDGQNKLNGEEIFDIGRMPISVANKEMIFNSNYSQSMMSDMEKQVYIPPLKMTVLTDKRLMELVQLRPIDQL